MFVLEVPLFFVHVYANLRTDLMQSGYLRPLQKNDAGTF